MEIAPQLKYGLFFISIALTLTVALASVNSWRSWIIIYPIVNSLVMSLAYINNMPSLIMGKRENGRINYVLLLINAPWLFLTWLIWLIQAIASRESKINQISGTNVYIGQYPIFTYDRKFDCAIDLTAEFIPCRKLADRYICLPNLDGMPLSNANIPTEITKNMNVLVHCAQGHGRSATYTSKLIYELGIFPDRYDVLGLITKCRPKASPSREQFKQIKTWLTK